MVTADPAEGEALRGPATIWSRQCRCPLRSARSWRASSPSTMSSKRSSSASGIVPRHARPPAAPAGETRMSEPESFVARWSRLKSGSGLGGSGVDEKGAAEASRRSEPRPPRFRSGRPAPLESIGADSDIRQFLQAGVPVELARAALRSAWAADPSIRDFIGIAESQWDFNEPAAIPGFGSLGARDCALAAQLLASLGTMKPKRHRQGPRLSLSRHRRRPIPSAATPSMGWAILPGAG